MGTEVSFLVPWFLFSVKSLTDFSFQSLLPFLPQSTSSYKIFSTVTSSSGFPQVLPPSPRVVYGVFRVSCIPDPSQGILIFSRPTITTPRSSFQSHPFPSFKLKAPVRCSRNLYVSDETRKTLSFICSSGVSPQVKTLPDNFVFIL